MRQRGQDERKAILIGIFEYEDEIEEARPKLEDFNEDEYESAVIDALGAETEEELKECRERFQKQDRLLHAGLESRQRPGSFQG